MKSTEAFHEDGQLTSRKGAKITSCHLDPMFAVIKDGMTRWRRPAIDLHRICYEFIAKRC